MALYNNKSNSKKKGNVNYDSKIVKGIIALAVSEIQGVKIETFGKIDNLNMIKLVFNGRYVGVDVVVVVSYGYNVPNIATDIQESVKKSVETMSKYKVKYVDVHFNNVTFNDEEIN